MQSQVIEILTMTKTLGRKDDTKGLLATMAAGGIDLRPGTPSISDKSLAFVVNVHYTFDLPEAQNSPGREGLVIEVLLDQKFYAVTSVLNARPGVSPTAYRPPFVVKVNDLPIYRSEPN